jgi:hypothetical protein
MTGSRLFIEQSAETINLQIEREDFIKKISNFSNNEKIFIDFLEKNHSFLIRNIIDGYYNEVSEAKIQYFSSHKHIAEILPDGHLKLFQGDAAFEDSKKMRFQSSNIKISHLLEKEYFLSNKSVDLNCEEDAKNDFRKLVLQIISIQFLENPERAKTLWEQQGHTAMLGPIFFALKLKKFEFYLTVTKKIGASIEKEDMKTLIENIGNVESYFKKLEQLNLKEATFYRDKNEYLAKAQAEKIKIVVEHSRYNPGTLKNAAKYGFILATLLYLLYYFIE